MCLVGRTWQVSVAGMDGGWPEEQWMGSEVVSGWCGADMQDTEAMVRVWTLYGEMGGFWHEESDVLQGALCLLRGKPQEMALVETGRQELLQWSRWKTRVEGSSCGAGEKWNMCLKAELTAFADRLSVGCEREELNKPGPETRATEKIKLLLPGLGKTVWAGLKENSGYFKLKISVMCPLSIQDEILVRELDFSIQV